MCNSTVRQFRTLPVVGSSAGTAFAAVGQPTAGVFANRHGGDIFGRPATNPDGAVPAMIFNALRKLTVLTRRRRPRPIAGGLPWPAVRPLGPCPAGLRSRPAEIAVRAYELYVQRGRRDGHDREDWLQAESELAAHPSAN